MKNKIKKICSTIALASLTACGDSGQSDVNANLPHVEPVVKHSVLTRNIGFDYYDTEPVGTEMVNMQAGMINMAVDTYQHPQMTGLVETYYPAMLWFDNQLRGFKNNYIKHGIVGSPAEHWSCVYVGQTELGIDCRLETESKVDNGLHGVGGPYLITTQMILSPKNSVELVKGDNINFDGVIAGFDFSHKTEFKKMTLESLGGNVISFAIKDAVITKLDN